LFDLYSDKVDLTPNNSIHYFFQNVLTTLFDKRDLLYSSSEEESLMKNEDTFKLLKVISHPSVYSKQLAKIFLNKIASDPNLLKNFKYALENVTSYIKGLDEEEDFCQGNL